MLPIEGLPGQSPEQIDAALAAGARFTRYEYCISLPLFTLRRPSRIVWLAPGERGVVRGLPYTAATLLLAWWGVPFLALYGLAIIVANLGGDSMLVSLAEWFLEPIETGKGQFKQNVIPALVLLCLIGWWGFPWGLLHGIRAIFTNLGGGHDATLEVRHLLERAAGAV